jgi:multidrug resistance efflux pump
VSITTTDIILHAAAVELDLEEAQAKIAELEAQAKQLEADNQRLRDASEALIKYCANSGMIAIWFGKDPANKIMNDLIQAVNNESQPPKEQPE